MSPADYGVPPTLSPANHGVPPPLFAFDGEVRECITGSVIGRLPRPPPQTEPFDAELDAGVEDAGHRRQVFQAVFDRRVWGAPNDPTYKGPLVSGNYNHNFIITL